MKWIVIDEAAQVVAYFAEEAKALAYKLADWTVQQVEDDQVPADIVLSDDWKFVVAVGDSVYGLDTREQVSIVMERLGVDDAVFREIESFDVIGTYDGLKELLQVYKFVEPDTAKEYYFKSMDDPEALGILGWERVVVQVEDIPADVAYSDDWVFLLTREGSEFILDTFEDIAAIKSAGITFESVELSPLVEGTLYKDLADLMQFVPPIDPFEPTPEVPPEEKYLTILDWFKDLKDRFGDTTLKDTFLEMVKSYGTIGYMPDAVRNAVIAGALNQIVLNRRHYSMLVAAKADFMPLEAYMKAFAVSVNPDFSFAKFVSEYNMVCRRLPKITTVSWFEMVDKEKTSQRKSAQMGVHLEEVGEMVSTMIVASSPNGSEVLQAKLVQLENLLNEVAAEFKTGEVEYSVTDEDDFDDSILDQAVTLAGVANLNNVDFLEKQARVDWANFTKFVSVIPQYKEGGKVAKGPWFWDPVTGA